MVMADTVRGPGSDAAIVRIHDTSRGLAMTTDSTPRYCVADPVTGGKQAVAEAWRNLVAAGAKPLAITNNLNFGNPERPAIMGQFVGCVQGMGDAARVLDFPVVSGNVSLYNETEGEAILPTPVIGGLGLIEDLDTAPVAAFDKSDLAIVLIGHTDGWLGASLYLREICGYEEGAPPPVDLAVERRNGEFVQGLLAGGLVRCCHDLSDGGLLVAVAEMALAGGIGAEIGCPPDGAPSHAWLFGEDQGRYLVAVPDPAVLLESAGAAGVPAQVIGRTGGDSLTVDGAYTISLAELRTVHEGWLPKFMGSA
jgi:phosphoribosylformylglycinamidine synthase